MVRYALFYRIDTDNRLPIQRNLADRLIDAVSRKQAIVQNPDRHIVRFNALSPKEKRWFTGP